MVASYVEKLPFFLVMYYKNSFHYKVVVFKRNFYYYIKVMFSLYNSNVLINKK